MSPGGGSRLLRWGQNSRCRECGNRIEWYQRSDERMVHLHPHELPAAAVPAACRWHVSSGVAHPAGDNSSWCRLPHVLLCPARDAPAAATGLAVLRRALAVHTRRMIDTGAFVPPASPPNEPAPQPTACWPARPIVQLLYVRYLATCPVEAIQCVARTRHRDRCPHPLLAPETPAGTWTLIPATATTAGQLALPADVMALYDLSPLPYIEQLRWRAQRCPQHAASPTVPDMAVADWEPFDPLIHHEHIHARLPSVGRRGPSGRGPKAVR
ncbi:DUF6083 domain-containing protein [Streptomyces sp. VNUA24]|uniref:DUF6083 domain-containing protein n=1 Tax=Streptomyces sp. VNUA24 TaxID=3031131 RepID=UPI0031BAB47C